MFREEQRLRLSDDDVNQCLHNKTDSHGVLNANLFNFTFLWSFLVLVLCLSAKELQQNSNASSREDYTPKNIDRFVRDSSRLCLTLWPFVFCLSFVNNSYDNETTPSTN